ncbi:Cobyrinate a,c-diamide synthase [Labeo rohita]|uniref:Cobyrinate a,c-diamide synthase n=1 Tax=Labeo rohita TaxID=84645 RepID=A0ABQ8LVZ2_LABRO|nr:Cobyrinate a,c-diamide synthase [Labeo rohita]
MRAVVVKSVDQVVRYFNVALGRFVPESRVRVREQKAAVKRVQPAVRKRAARARARARHSPPRRLRVTGQQRARFQVIVNHLPLLAVRRRRPDTRSPVRAVLKEVLQTLSAAGGGLRLLPEGRRELPLAHRELSRPRFVLRARAQIRVQTLVSPAGVRPVAGERGGFILGELRKRRLAVSVRMAARHLGVAVREAFQLLLQVFAVVHRAPAGRRSVERRLDVARGQIDEVQKRLHLAVRVRHRAHSHLGSTPRLKERHIFTSVEP